MFEHIQYQYQSLYVAWACFRNDDPNFDTTKAKLPYLIIKNQYIRFSLCLALLG